MAGRHQASKVVAIHLVANLLLGDDLVFTGVFTVAIRATEKRTAYSVSNDPSCDWQSFRWLWKLNLIPESTKVDSFPLAKLYLTTLTITTIIHTIV